MAELGKFETMVLYSSSGTLTNGVSAKAIVFNEGATVNGAQTIAAGGTTAIAVRDIGSFVAGNYAKNGAGGSVTGTVASTGGTTTITFNGSGTAIVLADGARLINYGTNIAGTVPGTSVYSEDQGTSTALTNSVVTADTDGNLKFWAAAGDYDVLIQNSGQTSDLYLIQDVTLNLMSRSSGTGLSGANVVYVTNASDDFAVGGTTASTAELYFDTSAKILYLGNATPTTPYAYLDGTNGILKLASTDPQIIFLGSAALTTLKQSATSTRVYTFPDVADGTVIVTTGDQTMSGVKRFSGGVEIKTTALSVTTTSTFTGAVAITGVAFTMSGVGANTKLRRLFVDQGTPLDADGSNFTFSPGWGTLTAPDKVAYGTDQKFTVSVTARATVGATPTIILTFKDGTFTTIPVAVVSMDSSSGAYTAGSTTKDIVQVATTATTMTITLNATPVVAAVYKFHVLVLG